MIKTLEISARQTGKTTAIISEIIRNNLEDTSIVVCVNEPLSKSVKYLYKKMGGKKEIHTVTPNSDFPQIEAKDIYFDEFDFIDYNYIHTLMRGNRFANMHFYTTPRFIRTEEELFGDNPTKFDILRLLLQENDFNYTTKLNPDMKKYKAQLSETQYNIEFKAKFLE